jgi:hypothetical protein
MCTGVGVLHAVREAKIGDTHFERIPRVHHDVVCTDVTMHNVLAVQMPYTGGSLENDGEHNILLERLNETLRSACAITVGV